MRAVPTAQQWAQAEARAQPARPPAPQVLPAGAGAAAERLLLLEIDAHSRLRHPR